MNKNSTLFILISKVVHLRFPLYQHSHTKLFIKNFHIIDIHKKSCSLTNFHFIKTHKQFFPLYQYPPKSCYNNFGPFFTSQVLPDIVVDLDLPNENVMVFVSSLQTNRYIFTDHYRKVTIECFLKRIILIMPTPRNPHH